VEIKVTDIPEKERFEGRDDNGELLGFVTYQLTGNIIVYTHTEVLPQYEGKGVASTLAKHVMDDARSHSRHVVPLCPYLSSWLERHHDWDDIIVKNTRRVS
jgi:uncharacterized protein